MMSNRFSTDFKQKALNRLNKNGIDSKKAFDNEVRNINNSNFKSGLRKIAEEAGSELGFKKGLRLTKYDKSVSKEEIQILLEVGNQLFED